MFKIAIICGGPSLERGISLNSARSILDHLSNDPISIEPVYVDLEQQFYKISKDQLYSNTPCDFDFKLSSTAEKLSETELKWLLKSVHLVFPVIHGPFGEDGTLQTLLESWDINYIGSSSASCKIMFEKHFANRHLEQHGYHTLPFEVLQDDSTLQSKIQTFWQTHRLERAVIKPAAGGSSIGVSSVNSLDNALDSAKNAFKNKHYKELLIEPFCTGREFTVCVLENKIGAPVALPPSEIATSYQNNGIFCYRRKYLPTNQVHYYCPGRFDRTMQEAIKKNAEAIFKLFNMRDFARIDGWVLPDNTLWFSDLNPISGMEQNSFIFQQASRTGMTHRELLLYLIENAAKRSIPYKRTAPEITLKRKQVVKVLFGNTNNERQVSLMSGTNVWLKLLQSKDYQPEPWLLGPNHEVWSLPYPFTLSHTVEEIVDACNNSPYFTTAIQQDINSIRKRLGLTDYTPELPFKQTLESFLQDAKKQKAFLFLALHGAQGEDGTLQAMLDELKLPYNGSGVEGSRIGMDKYRTYEKILQANIKDVTSLPKKIITPSECACFTQKDYNTYWDNLVQELSSKSFVIKPIADGCSSGVIHLKKPTDLQTYISLALQGAPAIAANTFSGQDNEIELSQTISSLLILEPYIETDKIEIKHTILTHTRKTGWVEMTLTLLELDNHYYALNPSITVAQGQVLSIEEKFQGGTGINLTPPPNSIVTSSQRVSLKKSLEAVGKALELKNYARIDFFYNINTNAIIIIEANTLPALTPSTVLFHQALAELPPKSPKSFLEYVIRNAWRAHEAHWAKTASPSPQVGAIGA